MQLSEWAVQPKRKREGEEDSKTFEQAFIGLAHTNTDRQRGKKHCCRFFGVGGWVGETHDDGEMAAGARRLLAARDDERVLDTRGGQEMR